MAKNDSGPAFPISREQEGWYDSGMSLRDYFAGQAIMGSLPGSLLTQEDVDERGRWAYRMADAMLAARSKP